MESIGFLVLTEIFDLPYSKMEDLAERIELYKKVNFVELKNGIVISTKQFIEESARFYNCQFIISTHSPFLLDFICFAVFFLSLYLYTASGRRNRYLTSFIAVLKRPYE